MASSNSPWRAATYPSRLWASGDWLSSSKARRADCSAPRESPRCTRSHPRSRCAENWSILLELPWPHHEVASSHPAAYDAELRVGSACRSIQRLLLANEQDLFVNLHQAAWALGGRPGTVAALDQRRSEEHTSELQ